MCSLTLMPMFLGTSALGMALVREIVVSQVCRNSEHMYASGVDFSQTSTRNLLTTIGGSLNIGPTQTNSAVILTTVTYIKQSMCNAANLKGATCTNLNHYVITRQIQIGGTGKLVSRFGSPPTADLDAQGNVSQNVQYTNAANQTICPFTHDGASQFAITSFQQCNQFGYSSEVTVIDHSLDWSGFIGVRRLLRRFSKALTIGQRSVPPDVRSTLNCSESTFHHFDSGRSKVSSTRGWEPACRRGRLPHMASILTGRDGRFAMRWSGRHCLAGAERAAGRQRRRIHGRHQFGFDDVHDGGVDGETGDGN